MNHPTAIYKKLSSEIKNPHDYNVIQLGENMMTATSRIWSDKYLINNLKKMAWQLVDADGFIAHWPDDKIKIDPALPDDALMRMQAKSARFFGVGRFDKGVAAVTWTLQPDGLFWADEDGFGATRDQEISATSFIDKKGRILIPFMIMTPEQYEHYLALALSMVNGV